MRSPTWLKVYAFLGPQPSVRVRKKDKERKRAHARQTIGGVPGRSAFGSPLAQLCRARSSLTKQPVRMVIGVSGWGETERVAWQTGGSIR